jgi:uncharacterized protein
MHAGSGTPWPMSDVHLVPMTSSDSPEAMEAKLRALFESAGLADCFREKDLVALKLHVGEPGTGTFVSPKIVKVLVTLLQEIGARPFLTDTSVLYKSPRDNGIGHTRVAHEHGFTLEAVGAPFLPADGLNGADEIEIEIGGKHYDRVAIASAIVHARSMLLLTHATGHLGTGYGGALKNLGMGCCSRKGKLRQHHGHQPRINEDLCTACGTCAEWCPTDAIRVEKTAKIDPAKCIGCGECLAVCLDGAVAFDWGIAGKELSERIVEHARGVTLGKADRMACVTVAIDITKNCDCLGVLEEGLLPDIGVLASTDPVAIDRAVLDLVAERAGRTLESMSYPDRDGRHQLAYAEALGLGKNAVSLVTV